MSPSSGMTGATKDEYGPEIHMAKVNQYGDGQAFVLRYVLCLLSSLSSFLGLTLGKTALLEEPQHSNWLPRFYKYGANKHEHISFSAPPFVYLAG